MVSVMPVTMAMAVSMPMIAVTAVAIGIAVGRRVHTRAHAHPHVSHGAAHTTHSHHWIHARTVATRAHRIARCSTVAKIAVEAHN